MKLIILIKFLITAFLVQHRTTRACYETIPRAECSELSLTRVPTNLNRDITSLDLSKNPIGQLGPTDFGPYTELETLLLSDCNLKQLPEVIFSKLRKLIMVDIARNNLASIPGNIFEYNKNFRQVVLDENGPLLLRSPIIISSSLEILSISACGIDYIYNEAFSRVPNLKELDLSGNPLQRVTPNAFRNIILKQLWVDSVNCLKPVAHKLCADKVTINFDVDSMSEDLCILQATKDSSTLEVTHSFTVKTTIMTFSSQKYLDTRLNQSIVVSSTTSSVSITPSTQKTFHETISTVGTRRTTTTSTITTLSAEKYTDTGLNQSNVDSSTTSSVSVTHATQKTFHETISTAGARTTDSSTKVTEPAMADDEVIRVRIGKTELFVFSGLIVFGLIIVLTYRCKCKIRNGRGNENRPEHKYDYVLPHYYRIKYDSGHELPYDFNDHHNGYTPIIVPPPLPPRPPTIPT